MLDRTLPRVKNQQFGPSGILLIPLSALSHTHTQNDVGSPIRNLHKDMQIVSECTNDMGVRLPATQAATQMVEQAMEQGLEHCDIAALFCLLNSKDS